MAVKKSSPTPERPKNVIQLTLPGVTFLCIAVVVAAQLVSFGLNRYPWFHPAAGRAVSAEKTIGKTSPWGELMVQELQLERPQEYIEFTAKPDRVVSWSLGSTPAEQVRELLAKCGLTPAQVASAVSAKSMHVAAGRTTLTPDDDLVLALSPAVRAQLYIQLAALPDNPQKYNPFICPPEKITDLIAECDLAPQLAATFRKLLYTVQGKQCFSDQEVMLRLIPTAEQRTRFMQCILRQTALLVRVKVSPDSDIEKLLGYWTAPANAARPLDTRPLLESLKRNADGGSASILYLLPNFARQHLNTFPLLTMSGSAKMNCHWSTFNFFNETPDDRFGDMDFLNKNLVANYYSVAKPSAYGDVILLLDDKNNLIHSAVQIADDIVFTKNGAAYDQPWTLMHLKDVLEIYTLTPGLHTSVWRNKQM
jgi:hypothetical protein